MYNLKDRVYLTDSDLLSKIGAICAQMKPPFLEIGPGSGNITRFIPDPKILVESDLSQRDNLKQYKTVYFTKIQELKDLNVRSCVSNLPFSQTIPILVHCVLNIPALTDFLVIVQEEIGLKMLRGRSVLYHKMNHLFDIELTHRVPKSMFRPVPKVNGVLLRLRKKPNFNRKYLSALSSINRPNKTLKNNGFPCEISGRLKDYDSHELHELYELYTKQNNL